jgi:signal transduction histidine kinase
MARRTLLVTYLATYLLAVGAIIRILVRFREDRILSIALLVGGYLVLLFSELFIIRRNRLLTYIYLLVQTAIICTLSLITPNVDFWAALFCPLVVQVMHSFPQRTGFLITGIFTVITSILLLLGLGPEVGLPLIFTYGVIYFLLAAFIAIIREAEAARGESQKQQAELESAHRQLQTYTARAEELAVLQERDRLARELHDSVTQSLYSLTLFTQAARELAEAGNLERTQHNLARIAHTAGQALKEMRLLVYELRPLALTDVRLIEALQHRLDAVEGRSGVQARLLLEAEEDIELSATVEEELYRIAQEALNNALKHAHATSVAVRLVVPADSRRLEFEVSDDGCGFDTDAVKGKGGLGLTSIRERADRLGAELSVSSTPGQGTQVKIGMEIAP